MLKLSLVVDARVIGKTGAGFKGMGCILRPFRREPADMTRSQKKVGAGLARWGCSPYTQRGLVRARVASCRSGGGFLTPNENNNTADTLDAETAVAGDAAWVELDRSAFLGNIDFFCRSLQRRAAAPGQVRPLVGVVLKGNAYGHGLAEMAGIVAEHKAVDIVYVFSLAEARQAARSLRPEQRILILGAHPARMPEGPEASRFEWVVSSASQLAGLLGWAELCKPGRSEELMSRGRVDLHIHFDTGLGREGFGAQAGIEAAKTLVASGAFAIRGCMTHFSNTEDVTRQDYALAQTSRFVRCAHELTEHLATSGLPPPERHLAATAAALVLPEARADAVRIGIGAYGLWPSNENRLSYLMSQEPRDRSPDPLQPVLSWRVRSQCIKRLEAGSYVGYGCSYRCDVATMTAVFPVGYADGYARHLTGRAYVLVAGVRCPVIGRVMMNHIIVALPDRLGVQPGDTVTATLIGRDGGECVTADDVASWSGTINYEAVTRISSSLSRLITGGVAPSADLGIRL